MAEDAEAIRDGVTAPAAPSGEEDDDESKATSDSSFHGDGTSESSSSDASERKKRRARRAPALVIKKRVARKPTVRAVRTKPAAVGVPVPTALSFASTLPVWEI